MTWTIDRGVTLYKTLLVTVSAMVAAYFGMRYRGRDWIRFIAFFGAIVILLSYLLVAVLPGIAIMTSPGLVGNWRCASSHKNYMGSIVAYCGAALLYVVFTDCGKLWRTFFTAVSYLLSVGLVAASRSATGLVLTVLLHGFTLAWLAFRRWGNLLTRTHYRLIGAGSLNLPLAAWLNHNRLLALLGRNSGLNGRVPFWIYLLDTMKANHLWFGYGLGALWYDWDFRLKADYDLHGSFPIINAHNGFLEVFLSLGVIGIVIFLTVIALTFYRILRCEHER